MSTASIASRSSSSGPSIMSAMSVVEDISTSTRNPLSQTNPLTGTCLQGYINTNDEIDSWQVPYQFYRLTNVEIHKDKHYVSGFTVTYKRPDDPYFDGWPEELSHTFGSKDATNRE